ncbi:hypothetical protein ABLG96_19095 [Nakamurella sp. A5-74]|uniref:Membrane-anchored protein n=1 Tax=Nakamurella sp. A5-74 TaxID=3158264 RepID=A0AAU8DMS5_9ACTN
MQTITGRTHRSQVLLSKVPEVTLFFWIIKILCTTVGETAADFLNVNLGFGLGLTSLVTGALLALVLVAQFRANRYIPALYWLTVALISVFGTLVTDNLTDVAGFPLEASTLIFAALLATTFLVWYVSERTLSIHSILTRRREAYYWLTILFTFALGTAAGDLMAEGLGLGYLTTGLIVAGVVALSVIAWKLGANPILTFWIAYILTRPLGASIGDYLTQPGDHGGLGLGATVTSIIFGVGIVGIVLYLAISKKDVIDRPDGPAQHAPRHGILQTAIAVVLFATAGSVGYATRSAALASPPAAGTVTAAAPLGDLTQFRSIGQDSLALLQKGDQAGATTRIDDLEFAWDQAQARLKALDGAAWTKVDDTIDVVLRELRATNPDVTRETAALKDFIAATS